MKDNNVIYHLNVPHDKNKLLKEAGEVRYNSITKRYLERLYKFGFIGGIRYDIKDSEWFTNQRDWKISSKINDVKGTETNRLHEIFKSILKVDDLGPKFLTQKEGSDVHYHVDGETLCAINFLIKGDQTPISFKGIGQFYYDVALINTSHLHSVPKQIGEDRVLFKFRITKMTFSEAKNLLIENNNELLRAST